MTVWNWPDRHTYGVVLAAGTIRHYGSFIDGRLYRVPDFKFEHGDHVKGVTVDGVEHGTFVRYEIETIGTVEVFNAVLSINGRERIARAWTVDLASGLYEVFKPEHIS